MAGRWLVVAALLATSACGGATRSPDVDPNTVVTMRREGCFGPCPVYSVRITGAGAVTFSGESYVRLVGEATARVPIVDVQGLVDTMLDADFFSLEPLGSCGDDDIVTIISDVSAATTSLTLAGRTKTIVDDHGNSCAPRVLRSIEDAIDDVAGTARWVECDAPEGACFDPIATEAESAGG